MGNMSLEIDTLTITLQLSYSIASAIKPKSLINTRVSRTPKLVKELENFGKLNLNLSRTSGNSLLR